MDTKRNIVQYKDLYNESLCVSVMDGGGRGVCSYPAHICMAVVVINGGARA
jgi:hypothetical protein